MKISIFTWFTFSWRFTIITPDLLRTDSQENIYLEAEGLSNPVFVSIEIKDFNKISMLFIDNATLNQDNGFQVLKSIQVTWTGESLLNQSYFRTAAAFTASEQVNSYNLLYFFSSYSFPQISWIVKRRRTSLCIWQWAFRVITQRREFWWCPFTLVTSSSRLTSPSTNLETTVMMEKSFW